MSFVAQITADIANFDKNMKKAVDTTNQSTGKMEGKFGSLNKSLLKVGVGAAAMGTAVVAAGVGLVKLGISAGDAAAKINNLSTATSLSTDVIQELSYVATASNSSFDGLSRSMDSFQRRLKTVDEEGSKVNEMLSKLGVSTTDTNGELRNMDDLLIDTFSRLGDMDNGLRKNAIGTELFGRSWNEVALIVSSGSKGIESLRKEANELGLVLDKNTLQSADDFSTAMGLVGFQVDTLKTKIGASLVPILENTILPLLQDKIIPVISKLVESIARGVQNMIKAWGDLKAYFTTGDGADTFDAIVRDAIKFKDNITTVFTEIANTLESIWEGLGKALGNETESFLQAINRGFQNTLNLWRNLWIDFKKAKASETLAEEFTNIGAMFSNFGKGLVADVVTPVDKVAKSVKNLTDAEIAAMVGLNEFSSEIKGVGEEADTTKTKIKGLGETVLSLDSLAGLSAKISETFDKLNSETTKSGRVMYAAMVAELEKQKLILEVEYKFPNLSPSNIDSPSSTSATVTASDVWSVDNKTLTDRMKATAETVKNNLAELNEGLKDNVIDLSGLVSGAITDFAGFLGDAFAGDFSDFGANLLGAVGNFAQQFGGLVIAAAITAESLKTLITNPFLAVAAGAALIALGAVVSKKAQSMTSSLTGGGYSSAPSMRSSEVTPSMPQGEYRDSYSSGKVEFKISGDNLVGVLDRKETRRNRSL